MAVTITAAEAFNLTKGPSIDQIMTVIAERASLGHLDCTAELGITISQEQVKVLQTLGYITETSGVSVSISWDIG